MFTNVGKNAGSLLLGFGLPSNLSVSLDTIFHVDSYQPSVSHTVARGTPVPPTIVRNRLPCVGAVRVYWFKRHHDTSTHSVALILLLSTHQKNPGFAVWEDGQC